MAAPAAMTKGGAESETMRLENTEKRDALKKIEDKYQKAWADQLIFEVDAPDEYDGEDREQKFFGTMAYPYVNGVPHLGHAFTISKIEFAARVARAQGKRVLYPQGYHCTGMPIKACADKLAAEVAMYGQNFERFDLSHHSTTAVDDVDVETGTGTGTGTGTAKADITKFTNTKKGKAALKGAGAGAGAGSDSSGRKIHQFEVMLAIGVPRSEIHKFTDAAHWLEYFPPIWKRDMTALGCGVDWRRSFVTTDVNGFYDSFVRWQMNCLKKMGKIRYGARYTVYSPRDGQPCLDHDRAEGEGVLVQEYTAVKCAVVRWSDTAAEVWKDIVVKDEGKNKDEKEEEERVFFVAATLRPETLYGQTNLFVSPSITYGVYRVSESELYILTARAARNMAFQNVFPEWGTSPPLVGSIPGKPLVGTLVKTPLSSSSSSSSRSYRKEIYVVPMDTIKASVGTGIVASVPSDSPDDYVATVELAKKADFYGIWREWVPDLCPSTTTTTTTTTHSDNRDGELLPIIETPDYGPLIAPALVKEMDIRSPKDERKLAEAKDIAYKHGFYYGTMVYGEFKGESVQEAKPKVRQLLLDSGDAFTYAEPDGHVVSRSGDECVAALLPQWFLAYGAGDPAWREEVRAHVNDGENFNAYAPETRNAINKTLDWMDQWAVTRQFGLGTRLPWDETQLVESLSDSTIYMAYYTVSKYLHKDIYGKVPAEAGITVEQMTDQVWDYVFARTDHIVESESSSSSIPRQTLDAMRREFQYWYPLDVRISGKDLINNHLIFMLYIHQAIWGDQGSRYLPRGMRMNGHAMLNGEKMAKSTGNFLTLHDAVDKFGADAVRVALADAGDGVEDANVDETVANAVILKLFEARQWAEQQMMMMIRDNSVAQLQRSGTKGLWDDIFDNEMNVLAAEAIKNYERALYKAALKSAFYDLTAARDSYRVSVTAAGIGMHEALVRRYVELQARLMAPITPHWAEYIWREILGNETFISLEPFPAIPSPSARISSIAKYVRNTTRAVTNLERDAVKRAAKAKAKAKPKTKTKAKTKSSESVSLSSSSSSFSYDAKADKKLTVFVTRSWPKWQERCIALVRQQQQQCLNDSDRNSDRNSSSSSSGNKKTAENNNSTYVSAVDIAALSKQMSKAEAKKAIPFILSLLGKLKLKKEKEKEEDAEKQKEREFDEGVFLSQLGFDEEEVLKEMVVPLLLSNSSPVQKLRDVQIVVVDDDDDDGERSGGGRKPEPEPGKPAFELVNL